MIGLESNKITIDIHESKVPLSMVPDRVEIFHDGNILHNGKISFYCETGVVKVDIGSSKEKIDEVFNSVRRYFPFTFKFFVNCQKKVSYGAPGS